MSERAEAWHLDKKVQISIIGAIIAQTLGFVWIGSTWITKVEDHFQVVDNKQSETANEVRQIEDKNSDQEHRIIVVETGLPQVLSAVARLEGKIDRVLEGEKNK